MAMQVGTVAATTGLSGEIFSRIDAHLSPPFEDDPANAEAHEAAREGWRQLANAIADAVVSHLIANLEIVDVQTSGAVTARVPGRTGPADPTAGHTHDLDIANGSLTGAFDQVDGTGAVR